MRFTVARKIGLGFVILTLLTMVVFLSTYKTTFDGNITLADGVNKNKYGSNVSTPALGELIRLKENMDESRDIILWWAGVPSKDDHRDKTRLTRITDTIVPLLRKKKLDALADSLSMEKRNMLDTIFTDIESLFNQYEEVKTLLPNLASYDSSWLFFQAGFLIRPDGDLNKTAAKINMQLDELITIQRQEDDDRRREMNHSFDEAQETNDYSLNLILYSGIAWLLIALAVAIIVTLSITRPVKNLKSILEGLGKGVFPKHDLKPSSDEIGDMTVAMNKLVDGMKHTTEFANQVGQSNFDYEYQPLSDEDTLGQALMKMRDDLAENERILEQKVIERTEEVVRQKGELEKQKYRIEELYKDVTDSIRYAKRLQDSILPPKSKRDQLFPESFVLFKPKDIVSGDFYWMDDQDGKAIVAAVDCTGHGVPGAFMSLVGANALDSAVKGQGISQPAAILDEINLRTSESLNKDAEDAGDDKKRKVRDGMDVALVAISADRKLLEYAGANNPLYHIRKGELTQTKADKFAIGSFKAGTKHYANHEIPLESGDLIYIFSDGYADQFGGVKGKKFMYRQFRELIMEIRDLPMEEQGKILDERLESWKGKYEQIDDILVMGIRI